MDRATIINSMLSVVGESGVSAVTTTHPSVQAAARILDAEDIDFQQSGWWFNREYELTLVPDQFGRINVPADSLDMRISDVMCKTDPREKVRYARRGDYIYDSFLHTDVLNRGLVVDLISRVRIEDMPSAASSYLRHRAREAIYQDDDGDTNKLTNLQKDTAIAWAKLRAMQLQITGTNALDSPVARQLLSGIRGSGYSRNPNIIGGLIR